jgi:hypothetical protein
MKFLIKFNKSIDKYVKGIEKKAKDAVNKGVYDAADMVFAKSQEYAPIDKGTLRKSAVVSYGPGPKAKIEYKATYAAAVHEGTKPHEIRPKNKKALAFEIDGKEIVVKKVMHPGTEPRPFLARAVEEVVPMIPQFVKARLRQAGLLR